MNNNNTNNSQSRRTRRKSSTKFWLICSFLIAIAIYVVYTQFSFNFLALGILLVLLCAIVPVGYYTTILRRDQNMRFRRGILTGAASKYALLAFFGIMFFGVMCIFTLNNYFSPDQRVFNNADHHVMSIQGLRIANPNGFLLAGNSKDALYDSEATTGTATIASFNKDSVTLDLSSNFNRAIYLESYEGERISSLKIINDLPRFDRDSHLVLRTKDGSKYVLSSDIKRHNQNFFKELWHKEKDTVYYYLGDNVSDTHQFLVKGLPMLSLLNGISIDSLGIDLEGLHLIRPEAYVTETTKDLKDKFYTDNAFAIEVQSHHGERGPKTVTSIIADGREWDLTGSFGSQKSVSIPIGKYFCIGYDGKRSPSMKFEYDGDALRIVYRQPMMRYLSPDSDRPDNVVLLTQSLNCNPNGIDHSYKMLPDNIMLFDMFSHVDNINRVRPKYLTYASEQSDVKLYVDVYDYLSERPRTQPLEQSLEHGLSLTNSPAMGNPSVTWDIRLIDLKQQSKFQPWQIKWTIFIFTILLALLMLYGNVNLSSENSLRAFRPMYSNIEYIAYMVTIFMVTLRWFLLWRASVFPPVDHVSAYEFDLFQKTDNLKYLRYVMIAFVVIVAFLKWYFMHRRWKNSEQQLRKGSAIGIVSGIAAFLTKVRDRLFEVPALKGLQWCQDRSQNLGGKILVSFAVIGVLIVYALLLWACKFFPTIWFPIFIVIMVYLFMTLLIHHSCSDNYVTSEHEQYDHEIYIKRKNGDVTIVNRGARPKAALVCDALNSLATTTALMFIDSGFGILFFSYSIFWLLWDLFEYLIYTQPEQWKANKIGKWILLLLFLLFGMMIVFYSVIFRYLSEGGIKIYFSFALWGAFIAFLVVFTIKGIRLFRSTSSAVAILITALVFGIAAGGAHWYLDNKAQHTVQRIKVLSVDPDQALLAIGDNDTQRRYIQAAINHMIIGEYNERGEQVKAFGVDGVGYFKMQPHSTVGAMWGAQLTDISLVRFLIAEHTQYLGFLLIALYLLMLIVAAREVKHHKYARYTLIQIPLLLFILSLLIWMANTQKFVFLGQDFPMISINSSLSLALYFTLVIIWLYYAFSEKRSEYLIENAYYFGPNFNEREPSNYDYSEPIVSLQSMSVLESLILAFSMIFCLVFVGKIQQKKSVDDVRGFKPQHAMEAVRQAIEGDDVYALLEESTTSEDDEDVSEVSPTSLNGWLIKYQKDGNRLRSMSSVDLTKFISDFNTAYGDTIASCFLHRTGRTSVEEVPLGKNLWDNFVREGVKTNNRNNVIHARIINHKRPGAKKPDQYVVISVHNKFFNQELPNDPEDQWEGSLIASDFGGKDNAGTLKKDGTTLYRLPGEWMRSGRMTPLVSGNALVEGNGILMALSADSVKSAAQLTHGFNLRDNRFDGEVPHTDYIARNVRVNGTRMFVYPLGNKLFWSYNFANELYARKDRQTQEVKSTPDYNYDANLTLSYELQNQIYDIFRGAEKNSPGINELGVIIANGDGEIAAMVDYKRNYKLNPNDRRRINFITDSLYLIGQEGGSTARGYFGNNNLVALTFGPGSTQKPLTWTAVAAGIDYPWKDLQIESYLNNIAIEGNKFVITKFNGREFLPKHPFKPLKSDEKDGNTIGLADYMTNSSNVYNALMAYIGSWPYDAYDSNFLNVGPEHDGLSLFAKVPPGWKQKDLYQDLFPILRKGSNVFSLNAFPVKTEDDWLRRSVLQRSMDNLFGIHPNALILFGSRGRKASTVSTSSGQRLTPWSLAEGIESFKTPEGERMPTTMSYVEPSALLSEIRSQNPEPIKHNYFLEDAIRQTAIGAQRVWNVTPFKMAESFGRMVSLNQNYNLTIFRGANSEYKRFDDELISDGYLSARPTQFTGMHNIFSSGTATALKALCKDAEDNGYWLYAKTGTIAPSHGKDRHRFAVVICNSDLSTINLDDLPQLKFYVLYFSTDSTGSWGYYKEVLNAVMSSDHFQNYMKQND